MPSSALQQIQHVIASSAQFEQLCRACEERADLTVLNAPGALPALLLSGLHDRFHRPLLCVLPYSDQAERMKEEIAELLPESRVVYFPSTKVLPWGHRDVNSVSQQLEVVETLLEIAGHSDGTSQSSHRREQPKDSEKTMARSIENSPVILTTAAAMLTPILSPSVLLRRRIEMKLGDELPFDDLLEQLVEMDFERQKLVEQPGEMSIRGGIVDVFPFSRSLPIRLEFWGNRIESIREFDPQTQRSERQLSQVVLFPQDIQRNGNGQGKKSAPEDQAVSTLRDYIPKNAIISFLGSEQISRSLSSSEPTEDGDGYWTDGERSNDDEDLWHSFYQEFGHFVRLTFAELVRPQKGWILDLHAQPQPSFHGNLSALRSHLESLVSNDKRLAAGNDRGQHAVAIQRGFFVCETETHAERLADLFEESRITDFNLHVFSAALHGGFCAADMGLVVYTDHEFYGRLRRIRKRKTFKDGLTFRQLKSLSRGGYVVHVDHGIGVYQGLERIEIGGHERECIVIHYQENDKLFVPLDKMERVQKYTSREAVPPKIHKLGAPDWERLKKRTKKRIKDIARDLVKLYATRRAQRGFAFSRDTHWQKELEASFPYEDTPGQVEAVEEVKADMQSDLPMDRLVCGDVGYGKTEVAIRAAFKAVQDGKQVAVLVPTTLLAQQHFATFTERLSRYPVTIEVLSRFRTKTEQRQVTESLKTGKVDVVIGTHRLLSKDVSFKNLGLVVIDEEQRFGVRHKEQLKRMRVNVDVLTLSATPIPRTLHMSLMGVRDMSTIQTPPRDRLPVHTEVLQFDRDLIRHAILREVHRGGQVFFVHNRVSSIHRMARLLHHLLPEIEIGVAHGQMREHDLEQVMLDFMNRKYNVLLATMIIESGLDMPNVNTMIINRADRFGLAQLYQLRGRVGRSSQKAYCYLLIPAIARLTTEAIKRLETIEEFTDLGSGFQIAMRDLEIRGAGNLLGAEQSGIIDAVGFDLYTRILDEAVQEARREADPEGAPAVIAKDDCHVELDDDAFIPETYVDLPEERVAIYRRLAEATERSEIEAMGEELVDRFGRMPKPAENLLNMASLRLLGKALGLKSLRIKGRESRAVFADEAQPAPGTPFKQWIGSLVQRSPVAIEFFQNGGLGFRMQAPAGKEVLPTTVELLACLNPISPPQKES